MSDIGNRIDQAVRRIELADEVLGKAQAQRREAVAELDTILNEARSLTGVKPSIVRSRHRQEAVTCEDCGKTVRNLKLHRLHKHAA